MVGQAVRKWAATASRERPDVLRIGYIGSYARGDWGPGSDLDLVIVIERTDKRTFERGREWRVTDLPVPADILVYTREEWRRMGGGTRMGRVMRDEAVWVYTRSDSLDAMG